MIGAAVVISASIISDVDATDAVGAFALAPAPFMSILENGGDSVLMGEAGPCIIVIGVGVLCCS